jgi:hypothetical protein
MRFLGSYRRQASSMSRVGGGGAAVNEQPAQTLMHIACVATPLRPLDGPFASARKVPSSCAATQCWPAPTTQALWRRWRPPRASPLSPTLCL